MRAPAVYLGPAVFAQAVRDAERRAGVSHDDALGVHVDDDDADDAPPVERSTVVRSHRGVVVRTFVVRVTVGDVVHEYRVTGTSPADAAKTARHAHAHAGNKPGTCRVRLA